MGLSDKGETARLFANRITEVPDRLEGDEGFDISPYCPVQASAFVDLVSNATSCSPYLRSIISAQPEWVASLAERSPEDVLNYLITHREIPTPERAARQLRRAKQEIAVLVALADLGGVWDLQQVMQANTDFADFAVQYGLQALFKAARAARGGAIFGSGPVDEIGGLFVLAMGKMGAGELNYSSDIDLICLYDDTRISDDNHDSARVRFIRIVRRFVSLMSAHSETGYVLRTDLRLRPDPLVTPVCMPADAALRYYESFGRNWERAAFIKARGCAGDRHAASDFLKSLEPFIWRRSLDYASVEDVRRMRELIREKVLSRPDDQKGEINVKLGRGGIRDIELMTQTMQIIVGGRDPGLRMRDTLGSLAALESRKWIDSEVRQTLAQCYEQLRRIEHRVQMVNDAQTHNVPSGNVALKRVAALCGRPDIPAFLGFVGGLMSKVENVTAEFFAPSAADAAAPDTDEVPEAIRESIDRWYGLPVMQGERARSVFARIQPKIISGLRRAENVEQSIGQFEGFLAGLPAGVQLFSLLESHPVLVDLLTDICGTAPGLARHLARNAQVFDAVLDGGFFEPIADAEALLGELCTAVDGIGEYESFLDACRRWAKERHFQVGVQHLRSTIDWSRAAQDYSSIAEAAISCVWLRVLERFSHINGPPPGTGVALVAMGSLGAGQLTARSDLDLFVIYDDASDGAKRPATRQYYTRLTQALVSAVSAPTAEGRLYSMEMRQRPSGTRGPVATSFAAFRQHQKERAQVWEHMALTRARFIAGSAAVGDEFNRLRLRTIRQEHDGTRIAGALVEMRGQFAKTTDRSREVDPWEMRLGEGRLLDIELSARAAALLAGNASRSTSDQIQAARDCGLLSRDEALQLAASHRLLRGMLQVARLTVEDTFNPATAGAGAAALLLREAKEESLQNLEARLAHGRRECLKIIRSIPGRMRGFLH